MTGADAAREFQERKQLRASFPDWCTYALPHVAPGAKAPAAHQSLLIDTLQSVSEGKVPKVMIFMPPGSAKSTYGSVLFPTWCMQFGYPILTASHTQELADRFGRRVRGLITDHGHKLGIELSDESRSASRWATSTGTEYMASGVGRGIAGFRAGGGLIDDPIRTRQDADSELIRDRQWEWFTNDFRTRLIPGAWQIIIQTRWHEDDLSGRILEHEGRIEEGGQWRVISLPAFAEENDELGREPGTPLWDDDPTYQYGEQLRRDREFIPARVWSALYQQRPAPEEGDFFRREWFFEEPKAPPRSAMRTYGASDFAVTADGGDYTVHVVVGQDHTGKLWLLDVWRKQSSSDEWVAAMIDMIKRWKPLGWATETGQITSAMGPYLREQMRREKAFVAIDKFPTRGDKATRAQSIRGRMAQDGLYVCEKMAWWSEFRRELLLFPAGKHDDQVDAIGLVGQLLDKMVRVRPRKTQKNEPLQGMEAATLDRLWQDRQDRLDELEFI